MRMKILRSGLILSIDTTGKRRLSIEINYPMQSLVESRPTGQRPDKAEMKNQFRMINQSMNVSGLHQGNGLIPTRNENGLAVCLDWDANDNLIYEISIPVRTFWKSEISQEDVLKVLSLNITIPALQRPGGAGRPGGGRPGGYGSGGGYRGG